MQVQLDAVVPTVPTAPASSALAGQSTPAEVMYNVQTGTLALHLVC